MEIYLACPRGEYRNDAGKAEIGAKAVLAKRKREAGLDAKRGDQLGERGLAVDNPAGRDAERGGRHELIGFLIGEGGVANVYRLSLAAKKGDYG